MKIAVAREIKRHEYRVGLTPSGVEAYVRRGHTVTAEAGAGAGAGFADDEYEKAVRANPALRHGVNLHRGHVTHRAVAESLNLPYVDVTTALG